MKSLQAFLEPCHISTTAEVPPDTLTLIVREGVPADLADAQGGLHPFQILSVHDISSLQLDELGALLKVTTELDQVKEERAVFLVVLDSQRRVQGVVVPERVTDVLVALRAAPPKKGELGSSGMLPLGGFPDVAVNYYSCSDHPDKTRWAVYQLGEEIPPCPYDGKPRLIEHKDKK